MNLNHPTNPWYPLPADYGTLTRDGQRMARLAVLMDQGTPEKLVLAWYLFRRLYLQPTGLKFYRTGYVESPLFHYQAIEDAGRFGRNVLAAPRGTAKSVVIGTELPLLLVLTRPYIGIGLGLSTDRWVEQRMDIIMNQLMTNEHIIDDFGFQKPKRGDAIWNRHQLNLLNGSRLEGFAVMGRSRGARPSLFLLDDPEFDPESEGEEAADMLMEKFDTLLFKKIIPMLEEGSSIFWIGTVISNRSALYRALNSDDPRFRLWNRRTLPALEENDKDPGKVSLLWGSKMTQDFLETRKEEIGSANFDTEYLNKAGTAHKRTFQLSPITSFIVDDVSPNTWFSEAFRPLASDHLLKWVDPVKGGSSEQKTAICGELLSKMYRIITVDPANTTRVYSDYSAVCVGGYDSTNTLWILDQWLGKVTEHELFYQIIKMAVRWRVRALGVEGFATQAGLSDALNAYLEDYPADLLEGCNFRALPLKVPARVSKGRKILGLQWRFETGRIKFPMWLASSPMFKVLFNQIKDFTPDLRLLEHDDAIDSVSLMQYMVHGRGASHHKTVHRKKTLADRLRNSEGIIPGASPLAGIDPTKLTPDEMVAIMDAAYARLDDEALKRGPHSNHHSIGMRTLNRRSNRTRRRSQIWIPS